MTSNASASSIAATVRAQPYVGEPWQSVNALRQELWQQCDKLVFAALTMPTPSYDELAQFPGPSLVLEPRPAINSFVSTRSKLSYSIAQERAALARLDFKRAFLLNEPLCEAAKKALSVLGFEEVSERSTPASITYLPWLRIAVPTLESPLFTFQPDDGAPPIFTAVQALLTLLSTHPFKDGNGRAARLVCNGCLHQNGHRGYLPVSDITRASAGIWEELFARAFVSGDYRAIESYLLREFERYAKFVLTETQSAKHQGVIAAVRYQQNQSAPPENALHNVPHVMSLQEVLANESGRFDPGLVGQLQYVVSVLSSVADVLYCACSTDHLVGGLTKPLPLLVAVMDPQLDDLLLTSRILKAKCAQSMTLRIALLSDDHLSNARLLLSFCIGEPTLHMENLVLLSNRPSRD